MATDRLTEVGQGLEVGPLRVYLDTADWSYLEDGKDRGAEAALRDLGERSTACFLVSGEHFTEFSGLARGWRKRLDYVRKFPGTIWIIGGADQILELEAHNFAARCLGMPTSVRALPVQRMADAAEADLQQMITNMGIVRGFHQRNADVASEAPRFAARHQALQARLRRGGAEAALKWMGKKGLRLKGVKGAAQSMLVRATDLLLRVGRKWEVITALPDSDPLFENLVGRRLPGAVRRSREAMETVYAYWRRSETRYAMAPLLAALADLESATTPGTSAQKRMSSELDRRHVTFSPYVDVFTCDRRVEPALSRALGRAGVETRIMRTHRLSDVVQAVTG